MQELFYSYIRPSTTPSGLLPHCLITRTFTLSPVFASFDFEPGIKISGVSPQTFTNPKLVLSEYIPSNISPVSPRISMTIASGFPLYFLISARTLSPSFAPFFLSP